jgi:uncharacterized protein with von Willebrand factor type A (vWA) domain
VQIDQLEQSAKQIHAALHQGFEPLFEQLQDLDGQLAEHIKAWRLRVSANWVTENPFANHTEIFWRWQRFVQLGDAPSEKILADYENFCRDTGKPVNRTFWNEKFGIAEFNAKKNTTDTERAQALLIADWQKSLDKEQALWELSWLEEQRKLFLQDSEAWLELLQKLHTSLEALGLDPGIWLSLGTGQLSPTDIAQLKRWATYLQEDEGAKAICDLLGRMRQVSQSEHIERIKTQRSVSVLRPEINSKEEIIGLRLGKDIEHVIPSELALLSSPETAILFDLKYLDSRLLCFEMQGIAQAFELKEIEEDISTLEDENLGPMIVCIDTSGSMAGQPERIAKAMALFLASKAKTQKRPYYVINFSTNIEKLEVSETGGLSELIRFLSQSFHGGTDVFPALQHTLEVMQQEKYQNADVLVISDFIMADLPRDYYKEIEVQRSKGNQFHSLVVGTCFMREKMKTLFDHEWIFDPRTSHIQELTGYRFPLDNPRMRTSG